MTRCKYESAEPGTLLCVRPMGHAGEHETPRYAPEPCPYTVGRRVCVAGPKGHAGPHDWPPIR